MDFLNAGGVSIFMCKICNLFSPSQAQLLTHVSEKHTIEGLSPDEIIVPLRPLSTTTQSEKSGECTVKRKRGRPKGSTKKFYTEGELLETSGQGSQEAQAEAVEEVESEDSSTLECKKCSRKFCNKRQIKKHICIIGLKEEGEEEEDNDNDPDVKLALEDGEEDRERAPKRSRAPRIEKSSSVKDSDQTSGLKKPIISVVLTAHEAIPGATKIVPIEASPAETAPVVDSESTGPDAGLKRGYQEYAIQQTAYELPLKSNRLGQTQLKIFTCEYCNKVFKFKHSLQAHLRIHTNEKPFKCQYCDYASAIKANLSVHLRKHTGEKFSCEYCAFNCLSKGHLKVHVERVHKKIKQHCHFCKKKYSDVKNLLKHIRVSHDMEDKKVKDSYDELCLQTREGKRQLLYDCHICDRKFKNELDRDRHMMVHGSQRPFGCELCDHGSTKYQALEVHIRKHPFIYICAICLLKFVSSVRLKVHIREAHSDLEELTVFSDSINQSFCLLEPGSDVQRETLKQEELQMTEELSLLNTQDGFVPELGTAEVVAAPQADEGLAIEGHQLVQETGFAETMASFSQEVCSTQNSQIQETKVIHLVEGPVQPNLPEPNSESFKQDTISEPANEKLLQEECNQHMVESSCAAESTSHVLLPVPLETSTTTSKEELSYSQQLAEHHVVLQEESSSPKQNTDKAHEGTPENVETTGQDEILPNGELAETNLTSNAKEERTAFKQIVDSMQKRQLNMEVFEKIRKVYGDLECEYCGKLFWYQVHYNMHIRTHTREHLHYCSQCNYSSITKNCLKRHVIQKHSNILLKCPTEGCEYSTPDKYKLQAHLKIHTDMDKRSYVCPVCEKSFPEDRLIKSHIKTYHPDVSMNKISEILGRRVQLKGLIGKRASKCPYCDCYFMRNGSDLQQHIWAHEGVKPFKCSLCDYATRSKSNLKAHMNRHNTEKTHLCDMCGKKFKSKCTLKSHKLMHTADGRQFKCTVCEYTAAQKPQLLRHMEQHASFKPFRCAHCHYSCNMSGSLKRHYNKKHPNEQYTNAGLGTPAADMLLQQGGVKCPVCNFVYGTKWEMNRHLKNKHGLKLVETDGNQWEVVESSLDEPSTQYLHITETEDLQGTEAAVAALQDLRYNTENGERLDPTAVNILQQIIELGSENHDTAVASVVAMAPGTVTVVEQVAEEEQQGNHAVMIQEALQQASVGLGEEHHLVVSSDDVEGIETVTVYTQGEDASQFIVYVQEAVQAEEQTVETV